MQASTEVSRNTALSFSRLPSSTAIFWAGFVNYCTILPEKFTVPSNSTVDSERSQSEIDTYTQSISSCTVPAHSKARQLLLFILVHIRHIMRGSLLIPSGAVQNRWGLCEIVLLPPGRLKQATNSTNKIPVGLCTWRSAIIAGVTKRTRKDIAVSRFEEPANNHL